MRYGWGSVVDGTGEEPGDRGRWSVQILIEAYFLHLLLMF